MGQCFSCGKSKDRFKDKSSKICDQIHSVVTPLHAQEPSSSSNLNNGHHHSANNNSVGINNKSSTNMATSFSNMNITNPIKGFVSKKRIRYKQDGFDLDLTYITDNIIAMGYPASKIESVYRNNIDDVVKFLDSKHDKHYLIYNLCSERGYDKSKFHNRVQTFPFDDHNPPKIELIQTFCHSVQEWLSRNEHNVAVVHCKAGKGRTGTMICCYLLHSGMFETAEDALNHYGQTRTQDRKGVTIPSQVRYVKYYERLLREHLDYCNIAMYMKEIILQPPPSFPGGQGFVSFSISEQTLRTHGDQQTQECRKLDKSDAYEVKKGGVGNLVIPLNYCKKLTSDIKVEFYNKPKIGRKEKLFHCWFNTYFVANQPGNINGFIKQNGSAVSETYVLTLRRDELDVIHKKDKQNKVFSADFQLTMVLGKIPSDKSSRSSYTREMPRLPQDTPSESSEESSEVDSGEEGWESVLDDETMVDPRGVGYRILSECELASQLTSTSNDQQPELLTA